MNFDLLAGQGRFRPSNLRDLCFRDIPVQPILSYDVMGKEMQELIGELKICPSTVGHNHTRFYNLVFAIAYPIAMVALDDAHMALDISQETCLRTYRAIEKGYGIDENPVGYTLTIAKRALSDFFRNRWNEMPRISIDNVDRVFFRRSSVHPTAESRVFGLDNWNDFTPIDEIPSHLRKQPNVLYLIERAIETLLSPRARRIVRAKLYLGMSTVEISRLQGVSLSERAIRETYRHSLKKIRRYLRFMDPEEAEYFGLNEVLDD